MSTPFITAFAAHASQLHPSFSHYQIHQAIEHSVIRHTTLNSVLKSSGAFSKDSIENFHNLPSHLYSQQAPEYNASSYLPMTQTQFLGGGCGTIAYQQMRQSFKKPDANPFKPHSHFSPYGLTPTYLSHLFIKKKCL